MSKPSKSSLLCQLGWLGYFILMLPCLVLMLMNSTPWTASSVCFALGQLLTYSLLYLLPALLLFFINSYAGVLAGWLIMLILWSDILVFHHFGFHINGMVLNLIFTPGGIASMGLDSATIIPVAILMLVTCAIACGMTYAINSGRWTPAFLHGKAFRKFTYSYALAMLGCFVVILFSTGFANFYGSQDILECLHAYPVAPEIRMRRFLLRCGLKEPPHGARLQISNKKDNNPYPAKAIVRNSASKRPNIVWLVCESMRADLLTAEIMPNVFEFSKSACRFTKHYSGGHGTRPGMFSMFYGLHAFDWPDFLQQRRAPLLFDWLHEDNYRFCCLTSSNFTYPEFDKTVFATVPSDSMKQASKKLEPFQRDHLNIDNLIEFISQADNDQPFFAFCFFESTHAPYNFPDEGLLYPDYQRSINYGTVSSKDATALYHRYANAAHYLDSEFQRLLTVLKERNILEDTIVIITGDHGEEFFEKGRLGHNSTFVEEQIHVPLVMYIPGEAPRVVNQLTSHLDIPATIAKQLGVENPPEDFSFGHNMLAPDFKREHCVICGWDTAAVMTEHFKTPLPLEVLNVWKKQEFTDLDDAPCSASEREQFQKEFPILLTRIQKEIARFDP